MAAGLLEIHPPMSPSPSRASPAPAADPTRNLSASSISDASARGAPLTLVEKRFGDLGRTKVRLAAVTVALDLLLQAAGAP